MAALLFSPAAAAGREIPVYPGAKYDAETSKAVRDMMQMEAACCRTFDPIAKVAVFYSRPGCT